MAGRLVDGTFVRDVNGTGYIDGGNLLNDPRCNIHRPSPPSPLRVVFSAKPLSVAHDSPRDAR